MALNQITNEITGFVKSLDSQRSGTLAGAIAAGLSLAALRVLSSYYPLASDPYVFGGLTVAITAAVILWFRKQEKQNYVISQFRARMSQLKEVRQTIIENHYTLQSHLQPSDADLLERISRVDDEILMEGLKPLPQLEVKRSRNPRIGGSSPSP